MRIIGGEDDSVVADPFDDVGKHFFFRLGGKKPVSSGNVVARFLFTQRSFYVAALSPFFINPSHQMGTPAGAAFEKRSPKVRKLLRHAGIHQTDKLNDGSRGAPDGVHVDEAVEASFTRRPLPPPVHTKGNIE